MPRSAVLIEVSLAAAVTSAIITGLSPANKACRETSIKTADRGKALFAQGVDIVSFSDQAFVKSEYLTLNDIAKSDIFEKLPGKALMPVLKARTKTLNDIKEITASLKQCQVGNIFVVTGDPSGDIIDSGLTSLDVIPMVAKDFHVGGVAHPQVADVPKMLTKHKVGARFFIMQASYDAAEWREWAEAIKEQGINGRVPIIATIVPLTSPRVLDVIKGAQDISASEDVVNKFSNLDDTSFKVEGLALAKDMTQRYIESGIFKGIYIYSRSPQVVKELTDFIKTIS